MADLGFDADFLNIALAPPATPDDDAGTDPMRTPLDYTHFTVRMHPARQLAWWVAWNIDGLRLFPSESISRSGENFRLDGWNDRSHPFVWTKTAEEILKKANRPTTSNARH